MLDGFSEFDDGITLQILSVFPGFVLQQIQNSLAVRQVLPRASTRTELNWTYLGFDDDTPEQRTVRLKQANLVGPAGYVSMEDGAVGGFVQRGIAGADDERGRRRDGRRAAPDRSESRATEASVRGFWKAYRSYMATEHAMTALLTLGVCRLQRRLRPLHRRRPAGAMAGLLHSTTATTGHHRREPARRAAGRHHLGRPPRDARGPGRRAARSQHLRAAPLPPPARPAADPDGRATAPSCRETPFLVVRIMRDGADRRVRQRRLPRPLRQASDGGLLLAERVVVCDSTRHRHAAGAPAVTAAQLRAQRSATRTASVRRSRSRRWPLLPDVERDCASRLGPRRVLEPRRAGRARRRAGAMRRAPDAGTSLPAHGPSRRNRCRGRRRPWPRRRRRSRACARRRGRCRHRLPASRDRDPCGRASRSAATRRWSRAYAARPRTRCS